MSVSSNLILVLTLMQAVSVTSPAAEIPDAVTSHAQWTAAGMTQKEASAALEGYLERGGRVGAVVRLLDVLHEARSSVADGDHGAALLAMLELPTKAGEPLRGWIDAQRDKVTRARATDDVDSLLQLQSRISVITSELAGRRGELLDPDRRRVALRDLERLSRFADSALWESHALNWRLRGPLRLASDTADRAVDRFYRKHDREPFRASDRATYVKVLSEIEGGGFDAVNGYDWGGISIGIAQFSASGPYLGRLLQHLDRKRPKLYRRHVTSRGISVDADGWLNLDGRPFLSAIREMRDQNEFNPVLLAVVDCLEVRRLRRSLYRQQVVLLDRMLDQAMSLTSDDGRLLADSLSSSRGLAHLADAFINTGVNDTSEAFRTALRQANDDALVDAFVGARRAFYRRTGQDYQLDRIDAIDTAFAPEIRPAKPR